MPLVKSSPEAPATPAAFAASTADAGVEAAPGRPPELEMASNRLLVHPLSAKLVDILEATPITPNQVSAAGVAMAASAAACLVALRWPWTALGVLGFLTAWHVLDGADGDLARRTGRASPVGELVDGVCDHAAQGLIYVALAVVVQRRIGLAAWPFGLLSAACHFAQANAYESWRKTYRRWGYGAAWMRQTFSPTAVPSAAAEGFGRIAARLYLALSNLFLPNEPAIDAAMTALAADEGAGAARLRYREAYAGLVRRSGALSSNARTLALFVCVFAGRPVWFFGFEIVGLNILLATLILARRSLDRRFVASLATHAA